MFGDLPPNSSVTRFNVFAASFIIDFPTTVEPVKAILFTSGCLTIASPVISPNPLTILTTPSGKPASLTSFAKYNADKGVCSAGFKTTVQPVARAGATFQATIIKGKFHGLIRSEEHTSELQSRVHLIC